MAASWMCVGRTPDRDTERWDGGALEVKVVQLEVVSVVVDELFPGAHVVSHEHGENPGQKERCTKSSR